MMKVCADKFGSQFLYSSALVIFPSLFLHKDIRHHSQVQAV